MNIIQDQWGPLFSAIKDRVSSSGRRRLLFQCIGDLQDIAMMNFGADGMARPNEWRALTKKYANAAHGGDRTPTLILSGHLLASFRHTFTDSQATLTNVAEYADAHHFGELWRNLPMRRYYPVDDAGNLTDFALERQREILNAHFSIGNA